MQNIEYELLLCHTEDDRVPLEDWLQSLDTQTRARVRISIDRLEDGNFSNVEPVGNGVSELRLHFGPGYRVYFGLKGAEIHLIRGGSKATQAADIKAAKKFWSEHKDERA